MWPRRPRGGHQGRGVCVLKNVSIMGNFKRKSRVIGHPLPGHPVSPSGTAITVSPQLTPHPFPFCRVLKQILDVVLCHPQLFHKDCLSLSPLSGSACLFLSSELSGFGFGCPQLRPCSPSRLCLGLCQSQAVAEPAHLSPQLFEGLKAFRARDRSVRLFRPWLNMDRMLRSAVRLSLPVSGAGRPGAGRGRGPP